MEFIKNTLKEITLEEDTLCNMFYDLFLFSKLKESEEDIKNGRVISLEESKERMRKKYANFYIK